ncbi:hypothetical protein L9F63_021149 [Diploptera punctata]|uniref:Uncharacterized protein n=1 Tax=Diploptera punctata TaxID=6984 RepID=A0AAD7ZPJ7_DIPPU|nr:hypothetical protein L9F63_021149 [Diploptera punctata]
MRVINVPPDSEEIQDFLNSETQQLRYFPEKETQRAREADFLDGSTESTTLHKDTNSVTQDDISKKKEDAQNFLDVEKKYANNINKKDLVSNSEELPNETEDLPLTENISASTSEETNTNVTEDVIVTEIPLDSKVVEKFLESEISHTYLTSGSHSSLQSMTFKVKSSGKRSSSNVDVCGTVNLDKIVDELLDSLREDIVKKGYDKIKIPDIHETFVKRAGIIHVNGYFQAEQGWAKNLSTIQRTADVIASSKGNNLSVSCGFGLTNLEFGYDKYKAKFMEIGPCGGLVVTISKNSVLLNATVSWNNGTCTTTLDYLSLNKLGGFNLRITGLGPLNWLLTKVSDWLFKKFHDEIKVKIESALKEQIENQLKTFDCSKYLLGLYKHH